MTLSNFYWRCKLQLSESFLFGQLTLLFSAITQYNSMAWVYGRWRLDFNIFYVYTVTSHFWEMFVLSTSHIWYGLQPRNNEISVSWIIPKKLHIEQRRRYLTHGFALYSVILHLYYISFERFCCTLWRLCYRLGIFLRTVFGVYTVVSIWSVISPVVW